MKENEIEVSNKLYFFKVNDKIKIKEDAKKHFIGKDNIIWNNDYDFYINTVGIVNSIFKKDNIDYFEIIFKDKMKLCYNIECLKRILNPNEWMIDKQFLSKINYPNIYYIKSLGNILYNYLMSIPIPVITTYDPVHKRIYFLVGHEKRYFELDENISYFDFTYLVNEWLVKFFPKFCVEEEVESGLSDDEIYEKVQEGMSLDDALLIRKPKMVKDIGIITKIQITNDEFNFLRNKKEYVRITGSLDNLMPLSAFLKKFRKIKDEKEKRDFILSNSRELKQLNDIKNEVIIDYPSKMMMNFFIIRYDKLKNKQINKIIDNIYEWDRFKISFESENLERDCLRYIKQKRLDDGIKIEDLV